MRDYAKKSQLLDERVEPKLYGDNLSFGVGAGSAKTASKASKVSKSKARSPSRRSTVIAIIVGLIILVMVYRIYSVHERFHPQTPQEWLQAFTNHKKAAVDKDNKAGDSASPAAPTGPTFDFYTVLPSHNVVLNAPKQEKASERTDAGNAEPAKPAVTVPKHQFILQVAAYNTRQQALDMRTRLELMDLSPIITVSSEHDRLLYRVNLGPYASREAADNVRIQIQQQGVLGASVQSLD